MKAMQVSASQIRGDFHQGCCFIARQTSPPTCQDADMKPMMTCHAIDRSPLVPSSQVFLSLGGFMKRQSVILACIATLVSTVAFAQAPKSATKPAQPKYHRSLPKALVKEAKIT